MNIIKLISATNTSVAGSVAYLDKDPVESGPFWSDPDPGLNKFKYLILLGVNKSLKNLWNPSASLFEIMRWENSFW
jgi:hypothetical protein